MEAFFILFILINIDRYENCYCTHLSFLANSV